jgi:pimeloyl-ACP methyl ester carboxylesterase
MTTQKVNQQKGKTIGGFVDGSGWAGVYNILKKKGYNVLIVQNPTKSLADDVAVTKSAIDSLNSDVVLVGHSYGGVDLVYIAAFAPDRGESVASLIANPPPGAPVPPILPPKDGYLFLDRSKFAASFAADVEPELASFMADSQVPWGVDALSGAVSEPAWKTKPSHYLVASDDKMIPPPAQRAMAGRVKAEVMEVPGSHSVYVSKPAEVAEIIEKAATSSN